MADMRAVEIRGDGQHFELHVTTRPLPDPGPNDVLIRVSAIGVNGHDVHQLHQGGHATLPGESDLPGLEVAGTIEKVGPETPRWRAGDKVCALLRGGGYAEYALAPAENCLPIPEGWSFSQIAAMPEALFTTWSNVVIDGQLPPQGKVLINGGSSGIGLVAVQLLSALGYTVFATARGPTKVKLCTERGAAVAIDSSHETISDRILEATSGSGVDVVLDLLGAATLGECLASLAVGGRLQIISAVTGYDGSLDLFSLLRKQLHVSGTLLRPRSPAYKANVARALEKAVWPLLANGRIWPIIDSEFDLSNAAAAIARMEQGAHLGKIILTARS